MIRLTLILILLQSILTNVTAQKFKTADDSLAYSIGVIIAGNLKQEGFGDLNADLIATGLKTALKGEPTLLTPEQCNNEIQAGSARISARKNGTNKTAGEEFLATNKTKPGVVMLDDGLQYEVIKMGDGPKPKATDKVRVHYHGTLIDGTVFDSSVERGEPISFALNQVIPGWTEALQLMPVGSKFKVFIPYQLGYGERGAGQTIKPYSTLIFEIELLGIE